MATATTPKSEGKQEKQENQTAAPEVVEPVALPPVEAGNRDAMMESRAMAAALVSLAETRSHRAAKLVDVGDIDGLREEVGAIEDLLKRIAKELA
jgi:hypothetical protein